mgnify:CR=1 FL=1
MEERFYEEYAQIEATHWWFEGRRAIFDTILRSLELPPGALFVDLGCGTGANLNFLTGYGRVMGLDWGAAAGDLARLFTGQGLQIERFTYLNTFLFPVVAAVRLFRRLVPEKNGELVSDFAMTKPGRINTLLGRRFGAESKLIKHWDLPVGVSLLCLARKPLCERCAGARWGDAAPRRHDGGAAAISKAA